MKNPLVFVCGLCTGIFAALCGAMLWVHRGLIAAAIKGEELPEAPEGCPAFKEE